MSLLAASLLAVVVVALVLTWRRSRAIRADTAWWSRWYALAPAGLLAYLAPTYAVDAVHRFYKPFYLPTESMTPTLDRDDKIIVDMRGGRRPAVGDIILFDTPNGTYVKRVAAIAGDRIATVAGVPVINGKPTTHVDSGTGSFLGHQGKFLARRLREQLPGERGTHTILDSEQSQFDDTAEQIVPSGHVFVLGDNRDRSADSRVPVQMGGVGMVALTRIVGRPLFVHWSEDRAKIGRSLIP